MPHLSVPGAKLYYETWTVESAAASWVTLLNGFTRTSGDFKGMARILNENGFHVLALDNRGAGQTETEGAFRIEDSMADVPRVWKALEIARSGLLGISYGGSLALGVAIAHPQEVTGLMVVSSTFRFRQIALENTGAPDIKRYFSAKFVETHSVLVNSLEKEMLRAFLQPGRPQAVRAQRDAMRGFDMESTVGQIQAPTLIVHGTEDRIVDFSEAQKLVTLISGAKLAPFVGSGHLLLAEAPKRLYELTASFFKSPV